MSAPSTGKCVGLIPGTEHFPNPADWMTRPPSPATAFEPWQDLARHLKGWSANFHETFAALSSGVDWKSKGHDASVDTTAVRGNNMGQITDLVRRAESLWNDFLQTWTAQGKQFEAAEEQYRQAESEYTQQSGTLQFDSAPNSPDVLPLAGRATDARLRALSAVAALEGADTRMSQQIRMIGQEIDKLVTELKANQEAWLLGDLSVAEARALPNLGMFEFLSDDVLLDIYATADIDDSKIEAKLKAWAEEAKAMLLLPPNKLTAENRARLKKFQKIATSPIFAKPLVTGLGGERIVQILKRSGHYMGSDASTAVQELLAGSMSTAAKHYPNEFDRQYFAALIDKGGRGEVFSDVTSGPFSSALAKVAGHMPKGSLAANHIACLIFDRLAAEFDGSSSIANRSGVGLQWPASSLVMSAALSRLSPEQMRKVLAPQGVAQVSQNSNPRLTFATSFKHHPILQRTLYNAIAVAATPGGAPSKNSLSVASQIAGFTWHRAGLQASVSNSMAVGLRTPLAALAGRYKLSVYHALAGESSSAGERAAGAITAHYPFGGVQVPHFHTTYTESLLTEIMKDRAHADRIKRGQLAVMSERVRACAEGDVDATVSDPVYVANALVGGKIAHFQAGQPVNPKEWAEDAARATSHATAIGATAAGALPAYGVAAGTGVLALNAGLDYLVWDPIQERQKASKVESIAEHLTVKQKARDRANEDQAVVETMAILETDAGKAALQRAVKNYDGPKIPTFIVNAAPAGSITPEYEVDYGKVIDEQDRIELRRILLIPGANTPGISSKWVVSERASHFHDPKFSTDLTVDIIESSS